MDVSISLRYRIASDTTLIIRRIIGAESGGTSVYASDVLDSRMGHRSGGFGFAVLLATGVLSARYGLSVFRSGDSNLVRKSMGRIGFRVLHRFRTAIYILMDATIGSTLFATKVLTRHLEANQKSG